MLLLGTELGRVELGFDVDGIEEVGNDVGCCEYVGTDELGLDVEGTLDEGIEEGRLELGTEVGVDEDGIEEDGRPVVGLCVREG